MAVQIIHKLLSDLSGEEAHITRRFGFDKNEYQIDLTYEEDQALQAALRVYLANAQRITAKGQQGKDRVVVIDERKGGKAPVNIGAKGRREYLEAARAWARSKDMSVSDYGRVPQTILDMYDNRHVLEAAVIADAAKKVNEAHRSDTLAVVNGKVPVKVNGHTIETPRGVEVAELPAKEEQPEAPKKATKAAAKKATPAKKVTPARKTTAKKTAPAPAALFSNPDEPEEPPARRRVAKKTTPQKVPSRYRGK